MICQMCLTRMATRQVTQRSPDGRLEEAPYCEQCYDAKYQNPRPPALFPRPRFTIKGFMILVGVWAIANAVVAWVMRSNFVTGTPAQLRQWTIQAYAATNLTFFFITLWFSMMLWITSVWWHKRTGGLVPMPHQAAAPAKGTKPPGWLTSEIFVVGTLIAVTFVTQPLLKLVLVAPLLALAILAPNRSRPVRENWAQLWRTSSRAENALRTATSAWAVLSVLLFASYGNTLIGWGVTFWFPFPPAILIIVSVQLMLLAALAAATRRR